MIKKTGRIARSILFLSFALSLFIPAVYAQNDSRYIIDDKQIANDSSALWSYHFQLTGIEQAHPAFHALYSGLNSLSPNSENAFSLTTTMFIERRLWKNAAFCLDPEVSGGTGLSGAQGLAGALNGETYRIGNPSPTPTIARAFYQQYIPLGNSGYDTQESDLNQLAGRIPSSRITISAGKFSIADFYDNNNYSHDPRTQFFNWSLMSNGAWDYPANTRGYTEGMVIELIKPMWAMRISSVAVATVANHSVMEYNSNAHSETFEIERKTKINEHTGKVRLLISNTLSRAPSYQQGIQAIKNNDSLVLNVFRGLAQSNTYGGSKLAAGISADQELTKDLGIFARASWNDGKYADWMFTEIDQTASAGMVLKGTKWKRSDDNFGIAFVINGISNLHREFLSNGGYGFIIGDGALTHYGNEEILEIYYSFRFSQSLWLTPDYQFVNNPGYNMDRGPVSVYGFRVHVEY